MIIKADNLSKMYNLTKRKNIFLRESYRIKAISNLNFIIEKGSKVALIGPNGAGKSTLIKLMSGILAPTSGSIRVLGLDPFKDRTKVCRNISCIFGQRSQLLFNLPIRDTLNLYGDIYELDKKTRQQRIDYLIETFELVDILEQPVRKLSLGQRMKCELAAGLMNEPEILFLDEPTIGLDVIAKTKIKSIINNLHKEKKSTIILTSHDSSDIEDICERVIVISQGNMVLDESVNYLVNNYFNRKILTCELNDISSFQAKSFEGCSFIQQSNNIIKLEVDNDKINDVICYIMSECQIRDITVENFPLDRVISNIYTELIMNMGH